MTPLPAAWPGGALYFRTGPDERKARNPAAHPHVVLTAGTRTWNKGDDVVVEGEAVRVAGDALRPPAAAREAKYGGLRHFGVRDGCFRHGPRHTVVFSVAPRTVLGFGEGEPFSRTGRRFARD